MQNAEHGIAYQASAHVRRERIGAMPQPLFIFCDFPVDLSMKILSNTSQSFRTHLFHHSRTCLFLCFCVILLLAFEAGICQAEEPPHIPGTELQWGMPYSQANTLLPGTYHGHVIIQQQPFAGLPETHPVIGQYYFSDQQQFVYAQFQPLYNYKTHQHWQGDYEHITEFMTGIYDKPINISKNEYWIWQSEETQGRFSTNYIQREGQRINTGWMMRFDPLNQEEE